MGRGGGGEWREDYVFSTETEEEDTFYSLVEEVREGGRDSVFSTEIEGEDMLYSLVEEVREDGEGEEEGLCV